MRNYTRTNIHLKLSLGFALLAASASAGVVTYTDAAAWSAAVGAHVTETFEPGGLQSFTNASGGFIGPARGTFVNGSVYQLESPYEATFGYKPGPVYAAGAFWDTTPEGQGGGIEFTLFLSGGGTVSLPGIGPSTFYGWISDVPFDSFLANGDQETYDVDNVMFGVAVDTPEPGSWGLLASGIGLIFAAGRRRR
ncbi:MAG: PEP-CTERM sorting domain-containing protein [Bryobacteraceae bacterium]